MTDQLMTRQPDHSVVVPVYLLSVVEALSFAPEDDVIDFVKQLDALRAEWEFTEKLYRFFKEQHKEYKAECKKYKKMSKG